MTIRNLDLDVEIKNINFQKGENKSEEFTAINPIQQVPVLVEDDGFTLTESRAIIAYLVATRNPESTLYPRDPEKRAVVDERLYYDATTVFFSHIQILVWKISSSLKRIKMIDNFLASNGCKWRSKCTRNEKGNSEECFGNFRWISC